MKKKQFLEGITAIADGMRAKIVLHAAAIGEATLAVLERGEEVTPQSLQTEIERRIEDSQQGNILKPEDFKEALKLLESLQEV